MLFRHLVPHQSPTLFTSFIRRYGQVSIAQDTKKKNLNEDIIEMLRREQQAEVQRERPNNFKISAFANAIQAIYQIQEPIKSGDDYSLEVRGIGLGIKNRINQYFVEQDFTLARNLEEQQDALRRQAVIDLQRVPGIGRVKALALVNAGCRNIASLISSERYHSLLTAQQIICLKYIDHLDQTTSPSQAIQILESCTHYLSSQYEAVLVGEFRRGLRNISTPVMMLLHPECVHVPMPTEPPPLDPTKRKHLIKKAECSSALSKAAKKASLLHTDVIPSLKSGEVVFDTISETLNTCTGVVRIPLTANQPVERERISRTIAPPLQIPTGTYRRVVFHLVPQKSRATALLALTGDDELNRHMRKRAERLDMLLNEHGLWQWNHQTRHPPDSLDSTVDTSLIGASGFWSLVNTLTEEDVFEKLDMRPIHTAKRNWGFLSGLSKLKPEPKRFSTSFVGSP